MVLCVFHRLKYDSLRLARSLCWVRTPNTPVTECPASLSSSPNKDRGTKDHESTSSCRTLTSFVHSAFSVITRHTIYSPTCKEESRNRRVTSKTRRKLSGWCCSERLTNEKCEPINLRLSQLSPNAWVNLAKRADSMNKGILTLMCKKTSLFQISSGHFPHR